MKEKICKNCQKQFIPQRMGQKVCSPECAYKLSVPIVRKQKDQDWKERKKKLRDKTKTITEWRNEARYWFQRWIRIRDLGKSCISCDTLLTDIREYDAGHYFSAYHYKNMVFDERNVSGQCCYCNDHLSGNLINYRIGIQKRYGAEVLLELERLADDKTKRIITKEEYQSVITDYKTRVKLLEK